MAGEVAVPTRQLRIDISRTFNTGNYTSLKIALGTSLDLPNSVDAAKTFDDVAAALDMKISHIYAKIQAEK